jgi:hypothetical protein
MKHIPELLAGADLRNVEDRRKLADAMDDCGRTVEAGLLRSDSPLGRKDAAA